MSNVHAEAITAIRASAVMFHEVLAPLCQKHGFTTQQMFILAELAERPHQMTTQLADRVGILRTNFAAVCRKMEAKGLVSRERGKTDRRCVHLNATPKGLELLAQVTAELSQVLDRGATTLSEADFVAIRDGMAALNKLIEAAT